jgi:hypothetical protein
MLFCHQIYYTHTSFSTLFLNQKFSFKFSFSIGNRFRMKIKVRHGDYEAVFTLFDKDVEKLAVETCPLLLSMVFLLMILINLLISLHACCLCHLFF